jgi:hypothetical protein
MSGDSFQLGANVFAKGWSHFQMVATDRQIHTASFRGQRVGTPGRNRLQSCLRVLRALRAIRQPEDQFAPVWAV